MKLLEIQSSPRGESSDSITLTKSFIEACKSANTSIVVDTLNVWHERLPEFDYEAIGAKYKAVKHETMTEAESNVWERIQSLIQRFQNADRIVLGTPMWNFGLPYKLKHLIDLVAQRNYLFTYDGKQYGPLLNVEKAVAVYTRGSRYLEGTPIPPSFDYQAPYLDFWLRLIGVGELRSVIVDNAWNQDRQESEVSLAKGKATLEQLVEWFLATNRGTPTCQGVLICN
ncbi:MAG TPA: NAD(P)H-dependent oxidoreductase [Candidatus Acidoferrum sp.]|jgi:FMN-dependent NADH-azoreductase